MLRLNEAGAFIQAADQSYVEREGERYPLDAQATVNNRLKDQDKVYFATYSRGGHVFADFVEPYFEGIDDLYQLK